MVLLSHTVTAGNESAETWKVAYQFLKKCYPALDHQDFTVISDQDKGGGSPLLPFLVTLNFVPS